MSGAARMEVVPDQPLLTGRRCRLDPQHPDQLVIIRSGRVARSCAYAHTRPNAVRDT